ncbi:MAG: DUF484 family protein [Nitrospinae bacterium]|nr:DUF484 family protein [Nitrospinota bacterium]
MKNEMVAQAVKMTNTQLRQYNSALRKNLRFLISCSTENEKTQQKMDEMEEVIFTAGDLKSLADSLITGGKKVFGMDAITVTLENSLISHFPAGYKEPGGGVFINSSNVSFRDSQWLSARLGESDEPSLRGDLRSGSSDFFNGSAAKLRSEAILPVYFEGRPVAAVAFGSKNPSRFMEGFGGRYLKRMARTLALKIGYFTAAGPETLVTNQVTSGGAAG